MIAAAAVLSGMLAAAPFTVEPEVIRLGEQHSATARFQLEGCEGVGLEPRLSVNVGSFGPVRRMGSGHFEADYTPPDARFPQVALVARWCEGAANGDIDFLRIPLQGQTELPIVTRPGSRVHVEVGGETFGPVEADAQGNATLNIFVPPGAESALVVSQDPSGTMMETTVPVELPPYNRVTVAVSPSVVRKGSAAVAKVEVLYDGQLTAEQVHAVPSRGALFLVDADGDRFRYRYEPGRDDPPGDVSVDVMVDGDDASRAGTKITLLPEPAVATRAGVGPRVGFATGVQEAAGARVGLDAWVPFEWKQRAFAASVGLSYGAAGQTVADPLGAPATSSLVMLPLTVRVAYQVVRGERYWLHAGVGAIAALGRFSATVPARPGQDLSDWAVGAGPMGFVAFSRAVGPGDLCADVSYGYAKLNGTTFKAQAGGLQIALGYRVALPQ